MKTKKLPIMLCYLLLLLFIAPSLSASPSDDVFVLFRAAGFPIVYTNESTLVEETTATFNGYLEYDGGNVCQYRFQYDIDSSVPYASATPWTGAINSPQLFSQAISMLTKGELYYFRAQANQSGNVSSGSEKRFLTKPDMPTNFQAVRDAVVTQVNLLWTIGAGADKSVIVRKIDSYPASRSDGLTIYNGTSNNYNDGAVISGIHYYYRIWSYCEESGLHRYSDNFDEDSVVALAPATFDIRDILVIDDVVQDLEISVVVENQGGILVDITVSWVLERTDTGVVLDMGSDTFAVGPFSTYIYTIYPSTSYVGSVIITFVGDGASASGMFDTQLPPVSGGGGVPAPPYKPPAVPPPAIVPPFIEAEIPCLIWILIIIIVIIIILIFYYREREKERKRRRRKRRS